MEMGRQKPLARNTATCQIPRPSAHGRLGRDPAHVALGGRIPARFTPSTPQQQAAWAMLVALHTALRSGEILRMSRSTVDLRRKVYELPKHKTEAIVGARRVPLTSRAVRLLGVLDAQAKRDGRDSYFTISDASRDVLYRKLRDRSMIEGLRFHDLRATALTLLSKRTDVMTLAASTGMWTSTSFSTPTIAKARKTSQPVCDYSKPPGSSICSDHQHPRGAGSVVLCSSGALMRS